LIAPKSSAEDQKAVSTLVRSNDRLAMSIVPAAKLRSEIEAVYRAGVEVGYFKSPPSSDSIYSKSLP